MTAFFNGHRLPLYVSAFLNPLGYAVIILTLMHHFPCEAQGSGDVKLGVHTYSFRLFTFSEALKKVDSCGVDFFETSPGIEIGGGINGKMTFLMTNETREAVKKLIKKSKLKLLAYGVVKPLNQTEWEALFDFAKDMGIQVINAEPEPQDIPFVIRLAEAYEIKVGIHNHPKPSRYWHPDSVLKYTQGSSYVGACADIGHWVRSGLDPVVCLKMLEGSINSLHFKDVKRSPANGYYHDVVWGRGDSNVSAVISELKRQRFSGPVAAEYEYNWENNVGEITESIQFFRKKYNHEKK